MPQSHAHQPWWSRQPYRTLRKHLRETASEAARTPGALARDLAWRQVATSPTPGALAKGLAWR